MQITKDSIRRARQELLPPRSIGTMEECLRAIDRVGLVWPFTPGNELLPALFPALAVTNDGQCWDWMWVWKDRLAAERQAYYGKVVGGKPTFVSLEWLPVMYALTGNTGDLEDDLTQLAASIRLEELGIRVCRYLADHGPTGTRTLIAQVTDGSKEMKKSLEKAIEQVDTAMLIAKGGTEGGNSFANEWDLFSRAYPEAVEAGTAIPTREAAVRLIRHFFTLTPAVTQRSLERVFPWNLHHQANAIARLRETGELVPCTVDGKAGLCRADFMPRVSE